MALRITARRQRIQHVEHRLDWWLTRDYNSGYSFPCDANGVVDRTTLCDAAKSNLDALLLDGMGGTHQGPAVHARYWSTWTHTEGICECGRPVELPHGGDIDCDCGRIYSCTGQELAPRRFWGEETGETLADIYSQYDPEEVR